MNDAVDWNEISDQYAADDAVTQIGPSIKVTRELTMDDLDDIFAGRPLAEKPRAKADVLYKAYLTADMDEQVRAQAAKEHIGKSALIRKALVAYLRATQTQPAMA